MRRAAEPHPHDRACGAVGSDAPRDRLSQRASPGAVPAEPAVPVPVVEVPVRSIVFECERAARWSAGPIRSGGAPCLARARLIALKRLAS